MSRVLATIALLAFLSACTGSESNPVSPSGPTVPRDPPTVTDPVDLGELATKPCDAVPQARLQFVGLQGEGKETRDPVGRFVCLWSARNSSATLVFIPYPDKPILRDVYTAAPPTIDLVRFTPYKALNRFPAVMDKDERARSCTVTVAVSDGQGFQFREDAGSEADLVGCSRAMEAALVALGKLTE